MAVAPDVEATRGQALGELADVEDGRDEQPEAVTIEESGHGRRGSKGGGGVGVRRSGKEAVEDRRGRDEERQEEHEGPDDVAMLPPPLAGITARQDTNDCNNTRTWDVEGLEEHTELWDRVRWGNTRRRFMF